MAIVMNVGEGGVNLVLNLKSKVGGMRNAHLSSKSLQECHVCNRTFKRNGDVSVRQVELTITKIDALPERLVSTKII